MNATLEPPATEAPQRWAVVETCGRLHGPYPTKDAARNAWGVILTGDVVAVEAGSDLARRLDEMTAQREEEARAERQERDEEIRTAAELARRQVEREAAEREAAERRKAEEKRAVHLDATAADAFGIVCASLRFPWRQGHCHEAVEGTRARADAMEAEALAAAEESYKAGEAYAALGVLRLKRDSLARVADAARQSADKAAAAWRKADAALKALPGDATAERLDAASRKKVEAAAALKDASDAARIAADELARFTLEDMEPARLAAEQDWHKHYAAADEKLLNEARALLRPDLSEIVAAVLRLVPGVVLGHEFHHRRTSQRRVPPAPA